MLKEQIGILKDYLPSLWKVALNKIKSEHGETKFEATAIIQITKNKGLKQSSCKCEDLRYTDEAELIEITNYIWGQWTRTENWH